MTHTEKLIQKANELKNLGVSYSQAADDLYEFHRDTMLWKDNKSREQFNLENGLSSWARPEKSIWRMYEILDAIIKPVYP